MGRFLRSAAIAAVAAASTLVGTTQTVHAQSYPIDCAILLCLSGGWPASTPCARARAEFIRRITPFPVEPPLQIWRCPMGASFNIDPDTLTSNRIYDILLKLDETKPQQSYPEMPITGSARNPLTPQPAVVRHSGGTAERLPESFLLHLTRGESADVDISGSDFDFVRSIQVFHVQHASQREGGREGGECLRWSNVQVGKYGVQGDFAWHRSSVAELPEAHTGLERWGEDCPTVSNRSVFVEYRDYEGKYGFEQVNY